MVSHFLAAACCLSIGSSAAGPFPANMRFGRETVEERIAMIDAAKDGELRLRPTFVSCGYSFGAARPLDNVRLECRESPGGEWRRGRAEVLYFNETRDYRGSLVGLKEDTRYEMRLISDGRVFAGGEFRTWSSETPIARTFEIDPDTFETPFVISARGSPDGWIRYTMKKDSTLRNTNAAATSFVVTNAAYVLLDDLVLRDYTGESRHVVAVADSEHVRVRNCDFAGWGRRADHVDYARSEWPAGVGYGREIDKHGKAIDCDGAVLLARGATGVVVERCWFHDAVPNACSWYYSHPNGPQAIIASGCGPCTVIRWNDFTGSDDHRWNDAIEGPGGNFSATGGLNRDADVYGNFVIYANDDGVELDGGQQNVRCFGNRFEGCTCGVSLQGCMVGPSYVYDNMCSSQNSRFFPGGQTIKTGRGAFGAEAAAFIWNNLLWGEGKGLTLWPELRVFASGNVFSGSNQIVRGSSPASRVAADNVFDARIDERDLDPAYPKRPAGFILDCVRRSDITMRGGKLSCDSFTFKAKAIGEAVTDFTVAQDLVMDWLEVSPRKGRIAPGADVTFTVRLDAGKMRGRRHWRACFLVRGADGLSRPVSVEAEDLDYEASLFPAKPGEYALYSEPFALKNGGAHEWAFDVPRAGRYWIYIHGSMSAPDEFGALHKPRLAVRFDGAPVDDYLECTKALKRDGIKRPVRPSESVQYVKNHPTWTMVVPNHTMFHSAWHWDFAGPGRHVIALAASGDGDFMFDRLALTDAPRSFEPEAEGRRRETVFLGLSGKADPTRVSRIVIEQFLRSSPEAYLPPGYGSRTPNGGGKLVSYPIVSLWVNALECARFAGHGDLERRLIRLYDDFLPGGAKHGFCPPPYHVDCSVFGALPYQIYLQGGGQAAFAEGGRYADTQWDSPERHVPDKSLVLPGGLLPIVRQKRLWQDGYTPQTRFWIDDMYMIALLQSQAYRATKDRTYIDRVAREMCLYLDRLQIKEGEAKGLFYHADGAPHVWGRGDGWMAAGMTLVLKNLPKDSPFRARILDGYLMMMGSLLRYQRKDGMWCQLVNRPDEPRNWAEPSCTGMFAFAFITGVRQGWLDPVAYGEAARRAWTSLCQSLDKYGNVPGVCCGTSGKDSEDWYFNRPRINGDPHGQASLLWCAGALLESR